MGGPAAGRKPTAGGRPKKEGLQRQGSSGAGQSSTFFDPSYSPSYYVQVDIVDLRAETNAISLARDQSSTFRKSSESQTDAAEVSKDSLSLDSVQYMCMTNLCKELLL